MLEGGLVGMKRLLRQEIKAALKQHQSVSECQRQGQAIVPVALKTLTDLAARRKSQHLSISIFLSMPGTELDTLPLISRLLEPRPLRDSLNDKVSFDVYVPQLSKGESDMSMMRLISLEDLRSFPLDAWGIPSPPATCQWSDSVVPRPRLFGNDNPSLLDLVFLPGVAFDESGGRLGHGKGYYDRFVARCELAARNAGKEKPLLAGLVLNEQLLPQGRLIPMGDHDKYLDYIITEKKTVVVNHGQAA